MNKYNLKIIYILTNNSKNLKNINIKKISNNIIILQFITMYN